MSGLLHLSLHPKPLESGPEGAAASHCLCGPPLNSPWAASQEFKSSKEARERLVRAYELMLGFYGIELQDRDSGAVRRAHNYQKRFQNLNW